MSLREFTIRKNSILKETNRVKEIAIKVKNLEDKGANKKTSKIYK